MNDIKTATPTKENIFFKRLPGRRVGALLIILHLAVVLPLAYFLNIWMDEASTLHTTEKGFVQTLQNVFADEKQAPLYFLLLSLWRVVSSSIFWARLFSILFSALAIKFFVDLSRKFFDENQARFASILFALNPFLIWTSLEIRGYSLTILLSILLIKFFVGSFSDSFEKAERENRRAAFILTAVAALYTNYYLGFLLVGFFIVLLVSQKWREARQYFLQMVLVLLAIAPLLWIIKQQFAVNTSGFQPDKSLLEGLRILWNHALTLSFPTELYAPREQTRVSFFRIWFVRLLILAFVFLSAKRFYEIVKLIRANRRVKIGVSLFDAGVFTFGVIAVTVGGFLLAAYFLLGTEYVQLRHMAVWFVPLGLFVFASLAAMLPRKIWIVFAAVFAFLYPYSVYTNYANLAKRGDWIRVARFIEANEKANQPIIIFQNYDALSLPYHYRGVNKILPDEKFFAWSFEANPASENALRKQIEFVISKIPKESEEIWLATEELCQQEETRKACEPLENYIEAHYTTEQEKDFYLEKVRLLRKKPK